MTGGAGYLCLSDFKSAFTSVICCCSASGTGGLHSCSGVILSMKSKDFAKSWALIVGLGTLAMVGAPVGVRLRLGVFSFLN